MGKVLIADDENKIRNIVMNIFDSHKVTTVKSWVEELEILEEGEKFDLIITDIVMPGYKEIAKMNVVEIMKKYNTPVIFISGYEEKIINNLPENMKFIKKPFSLQLLKMHGERLMGTNKST
ncbi:MAG: response regulator [Planctomycetota bacterium]|jgi:DNA-binding NtrC family response regulator